MDISKIIADLKFNADDTAIKNAEEALKQLDKQLDKTEEGTLAWGDAMRKTEQVEKALGKETKKLDSSLEGLEQSIDDLRKAQRKLDLSTEQGKKQFADFEKQIKSKQGTINQFKGGLEDTTKQSKGFGSGIAGMAKVAIPALAATFAVEKLKEFGQFILETEKKYTNLTNQIQRSSGLQAASLDKVVVQSSALADKFGVDTNELINSVKSFANAMEIDFTEALELAEKGFLKGADANGDFLSLMNEYPVQFKNAKLSGEEFVKFASQGALTGSAFGADKLLDTVKEIGLRLRELDKAQLDALAPLGAGFVGQVQKDLQEGKKDILTIFQEIIKKGREVGLNVQQQQKLIADLGGGALEDLGGIDKAFKLITDAQNLNLDSLDKLGQKQKEELETAKALAEEEKRLADNFAGLSAEIDKLATQGKTKLIGFFNDIVDAIFATENAIKKINNQNIEIQGEDSVENVEQKLIDATKSLEMLKQKSKDIQFDIDARVSFGRDIQSQFGALQDTEKLIEATSNQIDILRKRWEDLQKPIKETGKVEEEVNKTTEGTNKLTIEQIKNLQKLGMELRGLVQNWELLRRQTATDLLPNDEIRLELQFGIDTDKLVQDFDKDIADFKEKAKKAGLSSVEIEAGIAIRTDILNNQIAKADKDLNKELEKIALELQNKRNKIEQDRLKNQIAINDKILSNEELTEAQKLALVSKNTQAELENLDLQEEMARASIEQNIEDERFKNLALEELDIEYAAKREATYTATGEAVKKIRLDEFDNLRSILEDGLSLEEEQLREKYLIATQEAGILSENSRKKKQIEQDYADSLREIRKQSYLDLITQLELENQAIETSTEQRRKNEIEIQRLKNAIREQDVEATEEAEEKKQASISETIGAIQTSVQAVTDAIIDLIDLQIARYERSKQAQEERVKAAENIAEKGNAALLEAEQKRLDELEQKQERAAERQNAIAAGQAIAGAIAGIAQGAAQGGIVGIAAVIAALAAGTVAVTSLVQGAFADGVIDFQGKGTERSDSNIVAISRGESVITAKGTDNAPKALEMINKGLISDTQIFANHTPYMANISPVYALDTSSLESRFGSLEKGIDNVANAVNSLKIQVNSNISEKGVFSIHEKISRQANKTNKRR